MNKLLKNLHWIIIAVAAFNFYIKYKDSEEQVTGLTSQEEAQATALSKNRKVQKDILNFYKNIDEEKQKIEKVASEIERTQQLLPSEISDSEIISLLKRMADDVNIKEIGIEPQIETDRGFFISKRYNVKGKATYLQFLIFFEKIGENKRILNIAESVFKKSKQLQRGKFQEIESEFVIEAYKFNPKYKEDRGIEEIEKKFKDEKRKSSGKGRAEKKSEDI